MQDRTLTLGHSPDPDDAFMFYGLAKGLVPTRGFQFEHILQDIQTLNERATRGELDISAVSIHAYAYVSGQYALLPSGASIDRKSTRLNSSHGYISYAVFCLKKKKTHMERRVERYDRYS